MIWYKARYLKHMPWIRHHLLHDELTPITFKRYDVRVRTQIFSEYSNEFQQAYDRERTWQRLKA
jgi:hypothetical protein